MNKILANLMTFKNNPHASASIYVAAGIEILKVFFPAHAAQLADTQKILTWYGILAATTSGNPPTPPPEENQTTMKIKNTAPILLLCVLASFLFTGCASNPCVVGHVVSVTDRGFGVQIQSSTVSANSLPTVKLGFFSSNVVIEPVLTNAVAQVPSIASHARFPQSLRQRRSHRHCPDRPQRAANGQPRAQVWLQGNQSAAARLGLRRRNFNQRRFQPQM